MTDDPADSRDSRSYVQPSAGDVKSDAWGVIRGVMVVAGVAWILMSGRLTAEMVFYWLLGVPLALFGYRISAGTIRSQSRVARAPIVAEIMGYRMLSGSAVEQLKEAVSGLHTFTAQAQWGIRYAMEVRIRDIEVYLLAHWSHNVLRERIEVIIASARETLPPFTMAHTAPEEVAAVRERVATLEDADDSPMVDFEPDRVFGKEYLILALEKDKEDAIRAVFTDPVLAHFEQERSECLVETGRRAGAGVEGTLMMYARKGLTDPADFPTLLKEGLETFTVLTHQQDAPTAARAPEVSANTAARLPRGPGSAARIGTSVIGWMFAGLMLLPLLLGV